MQRVSDLQKAAPQPPDTVKTPDAPQGPDFDPKEVKDMLGLVTFLGSIGGALTRQPLTAALNNFSAGVHGYAQGKQEVFQNSLKEFDANLKSAKAKNDEIWNKYKAAAEKNGTDIQGALNDMKLIAAEYQQEGDLAALQRGNIIDVMKIHENSNNTFFKVMEHAEAMKFRIQAHQDSMANAAATRAAIAANRADIARRLTGGDASDWTMEQKEQLADKYRAQGPSALANLPPRSPLRPEIIRMAMQNSINAGGTGAGLAANQAQYGADNASLRKIVPMFDGVSAWTKMVDLNGEILKDLASKVDTKGVPVVERFSRAIKRGTDPGKEGADVAEFFAQLQIFNTEVARALTNPNLTGVTSDSARHEVQDLISRGASTAQVNRVVDRLSTDSHNRLKTIEQQYQDIDARMRKGGGLSTKAAASGDRPASAPPDAKKAPDGQWYAPDPSRRGKYLKYE
jgi:hypothetical protein